MKITSFSTVLTAAAAVAAAGAVGTPTAFAEGADTQSLGSQAKLENGDVIQGWTVGNLRPSSDTIPYPVNGQLWEATATDQAIQGAVTPIVSNFNARAGGGQTYRALFGAATPQGVNPATIAQGEQTSGKVYFDVTGDSPDSVVYNAGGQDLLLWVQPPPAPQTSTAPRYATPYQSGSEASSAPATTAAPTSTAAPGQPPAAPAAAEGTEPPVAAQGTPLPAGSQGTPLPASAEGAPLPASTGTAPLPAGSQGTPMAAGSQGTPLPAGSEQAPLPAGSQGMPAIAPSTPVTTTTVPPAPAP